MAEKKANFWEGTSAYPAPAAYTFILRMDFESEGGDGEEAAPASWAIHSTSPFMDASRGRMAK